MNNKGVGAVFCLISAILFSAKYLSAAIFMSGVSSWDSQLFREGLRSVGPLPSIAALAALLVGAAFLVRGIRQDTKKK